MVLLAFLWGFSCGDNKSCGVGRSVDISRDRRDVVMLLLYNGYDSINDLGRDGVGGGYVGIIDRLCGSYGVDSALLRALYPKIMKIPNTRSITIYLHINYIDIMA